MVTAASINNTSYGNKANISTGQSETSQGAHTNLQITNPKFCDKETAIVMGCAIIGRATTVLSSNIIFNENLPLDTASRVFICSSSSSGGFTMGAVLGMGVIKAGASLIKVAKIAKDVVVSQLPTISKSSNALTDDKKVNNPV